MSNEETNKSSRKDFLRLLVGLGAGVGVASVIKKTSKKPETVKLLTPDGKLVEIPASKIKKQTSHRVSNEEIQKWMDRKNSKS